MYLGIILLMELVSGRLSFRRLVTTTVPAGIVLLGKTNIVIFRSQLTLVTTTVPAGIVLLGKTNIVIF